MSIEAVSAQASQQSQPPPRVDRQEEKRESAKADEVKADRQARDQAQGSKELSVEA